MTKNEANTRLGKFLSKADKGLEKESAATERRLLVAYRRTLDDVQAQIARLFASTDRPTLTEMRKFKRLAGIEKQIAEQIGALTRLAVNTTHESIRTRFLASYDETVNALAMGAGVNMSFDRLPQTAIEYAMSDNLWLDALKQHNGKLLSDVRREVETALRMNARQEVVTGLAEGWPYSKVAKAIKARFDVTAGRAKVISFTEMHKSHSKGRLEGINRGSDAAARLGIKTYKVWKHNDVGIPRETHLAADGQKVDPHSAFNIGGVHMEAPGIGGGPEDVINCHCSAQIELELPEAA